MARSAESFVLVEVADSITNNEAVEMERFSTILTVGSDITIVVVDERHATLSCGKRGRTMDSVSDGEAVREDAEESIVRSFRTSDSGITGRLVLAISSRVIVEESVGRSSSRASIAINRASYKESGFMSEASHQAETVGFIKDIGIERGQLSLPRIVTSFLILQTSIILSFQGKVLRLPSTGSTIKAIFGTIFVQLTPIVGATICVIYYSKLQDKVSPVTGFSETISAISGHIERDFVSIFVRSCYLFYRS